MPLSQVVKEGDALASHQIEGTGSGHGASGALETPLAAKEALLLLKVGDASLSIVDLARNSQKSGAHRGPLVVRHRGPLVVPHRGTTVLL